MIEPTEIAERLVFFGTPEFALPTVEKMVASGYCPIMVVSQPARPAGRSRSPINPPVAEWARSRGIDLEQPRRVRDQEFIDRLRELNPTAIVVVAFGQIFPAELLALPLTGCINLHASLLPRYRGAAPIQAAVADGLTSTGVSTMVMEESLDSGPILLQREIGIGPEETAGELSGRLAELGAALMVETLDRLGQGDMEPRRQADEEATYAPRLRKEDGRINWRRGAGEIFNRMRAFDPWPGSFTQLGPERIKVIAARVEDRTAPEGTEPGTILEPEGDSALVVCGDLTVLAVASLQRSGRSAVTGADFLRGARLGRGERFG